MRKHLGGAPRGDLMRNPSSALDLTELYNMPAMNLQPNFYHTGPAQNQNQTARMPNNQFRQGEYILMATGRYDIQHYDIQHNDNHNEIQYNDTQHKGIVCDTQHKLQLA